MPKIKRPRRARRLAWPIRGFCAVVWPTAYRVFILQRQDPFSVWNLPKPQAIALSRLRRLSRQTLRAFERAVRIYYPFETSEGEGLAVITTGVAFLQAVQAWWREQDRESVSDHQEKALPSSTSGLREASLWPDSTAVPWYLERRAVLASPSDPARGT